MPRYLTAVRWGSWPIRLVFQFLHHLQGKGGSAKRTGWQSPKETKERKAKRISLCLPGLLREKQQNFCTCDEQSRQPFKDWVHFLLCIWSPLLDWIPAMFELSLEIPHFSMQQNYINLTWCAQITPCQLHVSSSHASWYCMFIWTSLGSLFFMSIQDRRLLTCRTKRNMCLKW